MSYRTLCFAENSRGEYSCPYYTPINIDGNDRYRDFCIPISIIFEFVPYILVELVVYRWFDKLAASNVRDTVLLDDTCSSGETQPLPLKAVMTILVTYAAPPRAQY